MLTTPLRIFLIRNMEKLPKLLTLILKNMAFKKLPTSKKIPIKICSCHDNRVP